MTSECVRAMSGSMGIAWALIWTIQIGGMAGNYGSFDCRSVLLATSCRALSEIGFVCWSWCIFGRFPMSIAKCIYAVIIGGKWESLKP